jgi:hypothetical protein
MKPIIKKFQPSRMELEKKFSINLILKDEIKKQKYQI